MSLVESLKTRDQGLGDTERLTTHFNRVLIFACPANCKLQTLHIDSTRTFNLKTPTGSRKTKTYSMTCRLNFNLSERLSCRYRGESHTEFVVLRVQTTYCSVVVLHRFINCTYLELCVFHCNRHCSTQTTCIDCRPYPKILSHSEWNVECDPGRSHQGLQVLDIVP